MDSCSCTATFGRCYEYYKHKYTTVISARKEYYRHEDKGSFLSLIMFLSVVLVKVEPRERWTKVVERSEHVVESVDSGCI